MNFIEKYVSADKLKAHKETVKAFQEGAQAPVPAGAGAPQEGGADPQQLLMAFVQAEQQQPQGEESLKLAYAFTSMVAQDAMAQQQAANATPAMRKGGKAPKPVFGKSGKMKK